MKDKVVHIEKWIITLLAMLLIGGACLSIKNHYTHYGTGPQTTVNDQVAQSMVY